MSRVNKADLADFKYDVLKASLQAQLERIQKELDALETTRIQEERKALPPISVDVDDVLVRSRKVAIPQSCPKCNEMLGGDVDGHGGVHVGGYGQTWTGAYLSEEPGWNADDFDYETDYCGVEIVTSVTCRGCNHVLASGTVSHEQGA